MAGRVSVVTGVVSVSRIRRSLGDDRDRLRLALHAIESVLSGAHDWNALRQAARDSQRLAREALGPTTPGEAVWFPPLSEQELKRIADRCFRQGELPYSTSQDALRLVHEVQRLRPLVPAEQRDTGAAQPVLAAKPTSR